MTLNMTGVLEAVADMCKTVPNHRRPLVFHAAGDGSDGLPGDIPATPSALVYPGRTIEYIAAAGGHVVHRWELHVLILAAPYAAGPVATAEAVSWLDDFLPLSTQNHTLGGRCTSFRFVDMREGFRAREWISEGTLYWGWELVYQVGETDDRTPKIGAQA